MVCKLVLEKGRQIESVAFSRDNRILGGTNFEAMLKTPMGVVTARTTYTEFEDWDQTRRICQLVVNFPEPIGERRSEAAVGKDLNRETKEWEPLRVYGEGGSKRFPALIEIKRDDYTVRAFVDLSRRKPRI